MKIKRDDFLAALKTVMPGVSEKEVTEQSASFAFSDGRVYTYNDKFSISHPTEFGHECVLIAKDLYKLISRLSDTHVDVSIAERELLVQWNPKRSGTSYNSKAGFKVHAELRMPIDAVSAPKDWHALPSGFSRALRLATLSASRDVAFPGFYGIHIKNKTVESCDNFRMTRVTLDTSIGMDIFLSIDAAEVMTKYEFTTIAVDDAWLYFQTDDGTIFSARRLAVDFEDINAFLNADEKYVITFPEETKSALTRASIFLADSNDFSQYVELSLSRNKLMIKVAANAQTHGWYEDKIDLEYSGESVSVSINPVMLGEILDIAQETTLNEDKSIFKFKGENFIHCCGLIDESEVVQ